MSRNEARPSDETLMERACAGDESAFEEIYERRFCELTAFLRNRLPGASTCEADDLASQALYKAFKNRAAFNQRKGTFRVWLFTIAVRLRSDYLRATARRIGFWAEPLGLREIAGRDVDWALQDQLRKALGALTQRQRDCLLLTHWGGFSYAETAAMLGLRPGSVAAHRDKALRKLRELLTADDEVHASSLIPLAALDTPGANR